MSREELLDQLRDLREERFEYLAEIGKLEDEIEEIDLEIYEIEGLLDDPELE